MRIIAREDELVAISDEAALELGSTWAGASFTIQNDTPTLHMYSTSEDAAFKYINSISRAEAASDVEIESASYSLANLNKIRLEISDELASPFVTIPPVVSSISVDIPSNRVLVGMRAEVQGTWRASNDPLAPAASSTSPLANGVPSDAQKLVDSLEAQFGDSVRFKSSPDEIVNTACDSNGFALCDDPLRGGNGVRVDHLDYDSLCTLGFLVQGNGVGNLYELTAGHCGLPGDMVLTKMPKDGESIYHNVGPINSRQIGPNDAAIVNILNLAGWRPGAIVLSLGEWPPAGHMGYNAEYPINSVGNSSSLPYDGYLCHTGYASQSTRCGQFKSGGYSYCGLERPDKSCIAMVENAGKVQMSVCGGDSGGPVFRIGRAYGIVGAGVNVQSLNPPLNVTSPIATYELRCGDATLYQGMYGALAATNTHLVVQ
jgi:hypothetical protein